MTSPGTSQSRPLVSIGVPTCGRARLLERALKALLAQDYPHTEIIISDNASTDDTPALCARLRRQHPNVRHIRHPKRTPSPANFGAVLAAAEGLYFMWAADDDEWAPTFISTLARGLEGNPRLVLAMSETQYQLEDGTRLPFFPEGTHWYNPMATDAASRLRVLTKKYYGDLIYGLYRREALLTECGTICDQWQSPSEIPIFLQVAARGEIQVIPDILFYKTVAGFRAYLYAAREAGFWPRLSELPGREILGERDWRFVSPAWRARLYRRGRAVLKIPKGAPHHALWFWKAYADISRTIEILKIAPELKRDLRQRYAATLFRHWAKLSLGWPLQDLLWPVRSSKAAR